MNRARLEAQVLAIRDTVDLRYIAEGTGRPTWLLFNGGSLPLEFWDGLADDLASTGRVVRFDQRSAGGTRASGTFSLLDVAADAARLHAHLELGPVIAVGHAWGGRVAQVFARDYPHRVSALVLCGTGGQFPPRLEPGMQEALRAAAAARDRRAWEAALANSYFGGGYAEREPEAFGAVADLLWADGTPRQHGTWDPQIAPSASYWGTARVPTLLLYGTDDRFGTRENAEDLARRIPDAQLEFLEGAGHFLVREVPGTIARYMRRFAAQIAGQQSDGPFMNSKHRNPESRP